MEDVNVFRNFRPGALGTRDYRAAAAFLAAGVVLTGVYFLLPTGGQAQSVLYDVIGVASAFAIAVGVWLHRPEAPLPWLLFALGNLCFAVADIIFNFSYDGVTNKEHLVSRWHLDVVGHRRHGDGEGLLGGLGLCGRRGGSDHGRSHDYAGDKTCAPT